MILVTFIFLVEGFSLIVTCANRDRAVDSFLCAPSIYVFIRSTKCLYITDFLSMHLTFNNVL